MRPMGISKKRLSLIVGALVVVSAASGLWLKRGPLVSWYYLRALSKASEGDRAVWVARVVGLQGEAVPGLLQCLKSGEEQACANAREAIWALTDNWGDDARSQDLIRQVADHFEGFSTAGKNQALKLASAWLEKDKSTSASQAGARMLSEAAQGGPPELHAAALAWIEVALTQQPDKEWLAPGRELVRAALRDDDLENRMKAVRLAAQPVLDLLQEIVPLLNDSAPEVRRLAMLGIGCQPQSAHIVSTDELLRWLHDSDKEVRRQCELALAGRGLTSEQVSMGREITDPRPRVRLQVLQHLRPGAQVDAGVWLRHLSHDASPAVRIAAVRAAVELQVADLNDRLDQLAHEDPCPTSRQLAKHYLSLQNKQSRSPIGN